ncbi:MAG: hypothetical protein AB1792_05295 [Candidatus Zixiibacteriota bacterium]
MKKVLLVLLVGGFILGTLAATDGWASSRASAGWRSTSVRVHTQANEQNCTASESNTGATSERTCYSHDDSPHHSEAYAHARARTRWRTHVCGWGNGWWWSYKGALLDSTQGANSDSTETELEWDPPPPANTFRVRVRGEMTSVNAPPPDPKKKNWAMDTLYVAVYEDSTSAALQTNALRAGMVVFWTVSGDANPHLDFPTIPGGNVFTPSNFSDTVAIPGGWKVTYDFTFTGPDATPADSSLWLAAVTNGRGEVNDAVPTLTEWGLIILMVLLTAGVVWTFVRRRRVLVPA